MSEADSPFQAALADSPFQAALNEVTAVLLASKTLRVFLRDKLEEIAYNSTQDKDDAKDIVNNIMRFLFKISPDEPAETEQDLKARIATLEAKIAQLMQPLDGRSEKETAAGTATPPFSVGEVLESKQGTIRGSLVVTRVYIADDGEGHSLWFADVAQCATGASYKRVYCDLLQRVSK